MNNKTRRKGFALILTAICAVALVPAVGLAIDAAILYVLKAKLAAACDGASLAAARSLSSGQTATEQEATARSRANSFYAANFPDAYLGSQRLAANINIPVSNSGSILNITTNGSARFPAYFMKYLGVPDVTINASGSASRQDVNLMVVLDQSSSMNTFSACDDMREGAKLLVNQFVDGRDKVGLIVFGADVVVAFPPARNFKSASTNVSALIDQIDCNHNTAMAPAYWEGYRRLANLNEPDALNVVLLFTDGIPNGVMAQYPIKTVQDTRYGYKDNGTTDTLRVTPASACSSPGTPLEGIITQVSGFANTGKTVGPYQRIGTGVASHNPTLVSRTGCSFASEKEAMRRDVAFIPENGLFGNKTRNYIGTQEYLDYAATDVFPAGHPYAGQIRPDRPWTIGIASKNQMDHAAIRARARSLNANVGVVTFVIGYGDNRQASLEKPDAVLMKRVANDYDNGNNTLYVRDARVPDGKFFQPTSPEDVPAAFYELSQEVLRLSH